MGWPPYEVMPSMGRPDEILTDPTLRPGNIRNPLPGHGRGPGEKFGPIVRRLACGGRDPAGLVCLSTFGPQLPNGVPLGGEGLSGLDPPGDTSPDSGPAKPAPRGALRRGCGWLSGAKGDITEPEETGCSEGIGP